MDKNRFLENLKTQLAKLDEVADFLSESDLRFESKMVTDFRSHLAEVITRYLTPPEWEEVKNFTGWLSLEISDMKHSSDVRNAVWEETFAAFKNKYENNRELIPLDDWRSEIIGMLRLRFANLSK